MGRLEDNIRLIRNERNEGGNTKERVAETFEMLAAGLGNKADKENGKGLSSNDFTNEHKNKLEGLQQVDTSGLLQKGAYTGNASDLAAGISKKVDKVEGKGLSSNDYTNAEKQKNEENAKKRVVGITVTGDVNKVVTLTFEDSTVIQATFKDNEHTPLADVHLNSMNFNENTGVLTGVKSDGEEITVSLDGRYSLIGHNHDERYAPITHHHNEYALRTHRHNWDDIDGKPNNLATTDNIKTAIEGIQIGGRNLLLNSGQKITNNNYNIAKYQLTEELKEGELLTVTIKGQLGTGKVVFAIYNSGDRVELAQLYNKGNNIHQNTFTWKKSHNGNVADNKSLWVWTYDASVTTESTIEWIKLERGNTATDWTAAPEDLVIGGKNYLPNSDYYTSNLFYCGNNISASNDDAEQAVLFNVNTPNENWARIYANPDNINYLANKTLTASFDLKVKEGLLLSPNFYAGTFMNYNETKPVSGIIELNKWVRVYTTFVAAESGWSIHLGFAHLKGKYLIKNFKIEVGNTPTDWSPSPKDLENKITNIIKAANVTNATDWVFNNDFLGGTIFIETTCIVRLENVPDSYSGSIIKVGDSNVISFSCNGKQVVYTNVDSTINGKDGSTATFSIYKNKCYVRIANV